MRYSSQWPIVIVISTFITTVSISTLASKQRVGHPQNRNQDIQQPTPNPNNQQRLEIDPRIRKPNSADLFRQSVSRSEAASRFSQRTRTVLEQNKVVLTCDAVALLNEFPNHAVGSTMKYYGTRALSLPQSSLAQERYDQFLSELIKNGELLKNGRTLITGDTFEATRIKICPLIPIC